MLRAATGERLARSQAGTSRIGTALEGEGPGGLLAVVGSVGVALLAMVFAFVVLQGAMTDVSDLFAPSTVKPAPTAAATR